MMKRISHGFGECRYGLQSATTGGWTRLYVTGVLEFLDFIFTDLLPPPALLRTAITGFLLARVAFWLFGDGLETPLGLFRFALALTSALLVVEFILNLMMASLLLYTRSLVQWLHLRTHQHDHRWTSRAVERVTESEAGNVTGTSEHAG